MYPLSIPGLEKAHLGSSAEQDLDAAPLAGAGRRAERRVAGEAVRGVGVDFGHVEEKLERLFVPGLGGGHGGLLRGLGQSEVVDQAGVLPGGGGARSGARGGPVAAHEVTDDVEVAGASGEDESTSLKFVYQVDGSTCVILIFYISGHKLGRLVKLHIKIKSAL